MAPAGRGCSVPYSGTSFGLLPGVEVDFSTSSFPSGWQCVLAMPVGGTGQSHLPSELG